MKLPDFKFDRSSLTKGPELRVPDLVKDLYADLRDRRLLPLVAVLIVAIVAAPILLHNKSDKGQGSPPPIAARPAVDAASFTVVPATNGIKSYKKRLKHRPSASPFNPFSATGHRTPDRAELDGAREVTENGGSPSTSEPTGAGAEPQGGGTGSEPIHTTTVITRQPKVVKATIKAQVGVAALVKAGYVGSEPKEEELEPQARIPSGKPAIVYNGPGKKGGALFLMTSQISAFEGDGHCVVGGSLCQVVELKPKGSETFTIGYGSTRYKIQLLGFEPIVKEEVVEYEGKKVRVPSEEGSRGKGEPQGEPRGTQPSPRDLLR